MSEYLSVWIQSLFPGSLTITGITEPSVLTSFFGGFEKSALLRNEKHVCQFTFASQYSIHTQKTLHTTFTTLLWLIDWCVWKWVCLHVIHNPNDSVPDIPSGCFLFAVGRSVRLEAPEREGIVWITLVSFRSLHRPVGAALHYKTWMFKSCHHLTTTLLTETALSNLIFCQRSVSARKGCYFLWWLPEVGLIFRFFFFSL